MIAEQVNLHSRINLVLLYCPMRNGHYGLGTHIGNLIPFMKEHPGIKLTIVKTDDVHSKEIHCDIIEDAQTISIPSPQHKIPLSCSNNQLQKRYADRIAEILAVYLQDKENLLFWVNSMDYINVCYSLKNLFENCRIMYVHHAWSWKDLINIPDNKFSEKWRNNTLNYPLVVEYTTIQVQMAQLADLVITVSKYSTDLFIQTFGIPENKIRLIYNGVSVAVNITDSKMALRHKYGYTDKEQIILFAGRIKPQKGLSYLLGAFKLLAVRRQDLRLIVVGDGDFDDYVHLVNPYWNRVTYTGEMEPEQLAEFYTMADIGVMPSIFEECGYTAIEMRFHKLPVIVSSVDGLDDMFEHKFDALKLKVYQDHNDIKILKEEDLALCISTLLDDPMLCATLTKNAYDKAVDRFSKTKMCMQYYKAISAVMQAGN